MTAARPIRSQWRHLDPGLDQSPPQTSFALAAFEDLAVQTGDLGFEGVDAGLLAFEAFGVPVSEIGLIPQRHPQDEPEATEPGPESDDGPGRLVETTHAAPST